MNKYRTLMSRLNAMRLEGRKKEIMAKGLIGALRNSMIIRTQWLKRQQRSINYNSFGNLPLRKRK